MNMKKQVFEYMDKHPKATTKDLVSVFPKAKKKSLWNYSRQWKKDHGIRPSSNRNSIRKQVFSYIDQNPDATQKELQKAFPNANKVSISNYHYQWRKSQPNLKKKKTVKTIVFSYLENHPEVTFRELKDALSSINPSSISAYHSIWKQTRQQAKRYLSQTSQLPEGHRNGARQGSSIPDGRSVDELIETLKTTIKTQEIAIEVMKEQNALLRQNQPGLISELESITPAEWDQLKEIITVFVRGLKNGHPPEA